VITAKDGTTAIEKKYPSEAEKHVLWFYLTSLLKEAKWSECAERYEEARVNAEDQTHAAYLDDAIIQVSLTYHQYDYGWKVYEAMKALNEHSPAIAMTLCWKAFFAKDKNGDRLLSKEQVRVETSFNPFNSFIVIDVGSTCLGNLRKITISVR